MTVKQVAERVGMSPEWVQLHAAELGGEMVHGRYTFLEEVVLERVTERVQAGRYTPKNRFLEKNRQDGSIAADVFEMLNGGATRSEIVIGLRLHPSRVLALTKLWVQCGQLSENELATIQGRRVVPVQDEPQGEPQDALQDVPVNGAVQPPESIEIPAVPIVSSTQEDRDELTSLLKEVHRVTSPRRKQTQKEDA